MRGGGPAGRGIVRHEGVALPMRRDDVDTDAIIPSREMRRVSKAGLGDGLFANLRYREGREPDPGFVLNDPAFAGASVLVSGANFGCGSSREHAVWALRDHGFRAVVAEGFGGIFMGNCIGNGVVPAALPRPAIEAIWTWVEADPSGHRVAVDLEAMEVLAEGRHPFALDAAAREMLMGGLSPIDVTLAHAGEIAAFVGADRAARPWLYPAA